MPSVPRIHTDVTEMEWHFPDVPHLGAVIMSPKALAELSESGVSDAELSEVLAKGKYVRHRTDPTSRGLEFAGVRLLFRVSPIRGAAAVCVHGYRVEKCWCGGEVGPRIPGDDDGLGCLEDIHHLWSTPQ